MEIHDSLSEERFKFYQNNTYDRILGLSATVRSKQLYIIDGQEVSKMQLLKRIAPVCYSYGIADAQREGTGRKLDIYIIYHRLDNTTKNIVGGNKKKRFMTTEKKQYDYLDRLFFKGVYSNNQGLTKMAMARRAKSLYTLPSKIEATKQLLKTLKGKTVIFNNDLATLEEITPNVVSSPRHGRTAKEQNEFNMTLRDKFDKGHIRTIASFKVLQQGANLKRVDNLIQMSYFSNEGTFTQRIGRLRKNLDKRGKVFIFVTMDTQEEVWYKKIVEDFPMEEFNVIKCIGIEDCLSKLK